MAQQPGKLKWKEACPHGLSASQFGTVLLGYSGRVSDYANYLRTIVGTEQEFRGNVYTEHGIVTEPKARALYEVLTGCHVEDGGFFLQNDRLLGCSPDGRIFYYEDEDMNESGEGIAGRAAQEPGGEQFLSRTNVYQSTHDILARSSSHLLAPSSSLPTSPLGANQSVSGSSSGTSPLQSHVCSGASLLPTTRCAVRIPFQSKRRRRCREEPAGSDGQPDPQAIASSGCVSLPSRARQRQKVRLLEIKSPYSRLYGCNKAENQPFGIPQTYMCQMQGQMAIAGADECDFFVYLDTDDGRCEVVAWRVHRCAAFWDWAKPRLLEFVSWVMDGLPEHVNRSFSFSPIFDFSLIKVEPLVFPYNITAGEPLYDSIQFSFFLKHPCPYYVNGVCATTPAQRVAIEAHHRIAVALQCQAVKFLFCSDEAEASIVDGEETAGKERVQAFLCGNAARTILRSLMAARGWNVLCSDEDDCLSRFTSGVSEMEKDEEENREMKNMAVLLTIPHDWEAAQVSVRPFLPSGELGPSMDIGLFQRDLFAALVPTSAPLCFLPSSPDKEDVRQLSSSPSPLLSGHSRGSLQAANSAHTSSQRVEKENGETLNQNDSSLHGMPGPTQLTPIRCSRALYLTCETTSDGSPSQVVSLLDHITQRCSSPQSRLCSESVQAVEAEAATASSTNVAAAHMVTSTGVGDVLVGSHKGNVIEVEEEEREETTYSDIKESYSGMLPHSLSPQVRDITIEDLAAVLQDAEDCAGLILLGASLYSAAEVFERPTASLNFQVEGNLGASTLVVAPAPVLEELSAFAHTGSHREHFLMWHPTVRAVASRLVTYVAQWTQGRTVQDNGLVLCFLRETEGTSADPSKLSQTLHSQVPITPSFQLYCENYLDALTMARDAAANWDL